MVNSHAKISIGKIYGKGAKVYLRNLWNYFVATLILLTLYSAFSAFDPLAGNPFYQVFITIMGVSAISILYIIIVGTSYNSISKENRIDTTELIRSKILKLMVSGTLTAIVMFIVFYIVLELYGMTMILFTSNIPDPIGTRIYEVVVSLVLIYVATLFSFTGQVILLSKYNFWKSITKSIQMVRRNLKRVVLVNTLLMSICTFLSYIVSFHFPGDANELIAGSIIIIICVYALITSTLLYVSDIHTESNASDKLVLLEEDQ